MSASDPMSEREYRRIIARQRYLPEQLRVAEEKVRLLRIEARRLGMTELLCGENFKFTTTSPVVTAAPVLIKDNRPSQEAV